MFKYTPPVTPKPFTYFETFRIKTRKEGKPLFLENRDGTRTEIADPPDYEDFDNFYLLGDDWIFTKIIYSFIPTDDYGQLLNRRGLEFLRFDGIAKKGDFILLKGVIPCFPLVNHDPSDRDYMSSTEYRSIPKMIGISSAHYLFKPLRRLIWFIKEFQGKNVWVNLSPVWEEVAESYNAQDNTCPMAPLCITIPFRHPWTKEDAKRLGVDLDDSSK